VHLGRRARDEPVDELAANLEPVVGEDENAAFSAGEDPEIAA
jgi:hypothetical protein